ncbi:hypothetical protein TWF718_009838 [Orbilia javanica]|uniref:Nucleoside phosphorylase domain-containing protein n=1 Tax=Orbilia javanica TaxID=47235 RepID=A0AAN8MT37_9PEZI
MALRFKRDDYSIGWICAIRTELEAVLAVLDETHPPLDLPDGDKNLYKFGRIGGHNIVISWLPETDYGTMQAGVVATRMLSSFKKLRFGLMVGVGGGAPSESNDIRLGDIVISQPVSGESSGVVQYDFGKAMENGEFIATKWLNRPPSILLTALTAMKTIPDLGEKISDAAQEIGDEKIGFQYPGQDLDILFRADYLHVVVASKGRQSDSCKACKTSNAIVRSEREYDHPYIHYGTIACANQVMKDGIKRDKISAQTGALCFEMEAAGLMNDFPCLVIRGICDYSDGHKNKRWQPYAALVAAIYAKELLLQIPIVSQEETDDARKKINFIIPFHMPFPRNPTFIGRTDELRNIYKHCAESKSTDTPCVYALTGTGGMGKTQIAIEYAYRNHRDYTAVFWVSAVNEDTVRASIIDMMQCVVKEQAITWKSTPDYEVIGQMLGIPGLIDEKGVLSTNPDIVNDIQLALFRWLQVAGNNKWLLIFDNLDDLETFDAKKYIPNHGRGAILITSRRPVFSRSARQEYMDGLDRESAVKLLLNLAQLTDSTVAENDAIAIVERLGFMPLAISHAGCFIHEAKIPLAEYLPYYEEAFMAVQSRRPRLGWDYGGEASTAATTWEISFSKIEEQDKEAAALLKTCSYLNFEEIPERFWVDGQSDTSFQLEFKNRILLLASYSLVRVVRFGIFSIHPVVHSWARERLEKQERLGVVTNAIKILGKASQRETVSRQNSKWNPREEREVMFHIGYLHRSFGSTVSESLMSEEVLRDINVHNAIRSMALVLYNQAKYDEAMQIYQQLLIGEKALGDGHLPTITTIHNMAVVLYKQGKYEEAMQIYKKSLSNYERELGGSHPSTHTVVHNIALVFKKQGKYDEAMEWYKRALAGRETTLGKDHLSTLTTVNGIASLLIEQGKYGEAMEWYKRALAGRETTLGKDHLSTLTTVNGIASLLDEQGKYDEAMKLYKQVLVSREKALGKDHPLTIAVIHNIAANLSSQGKYNEAMPLYDQVLTSREKTLGKDHPSTLDTIHNMALVLDRQSKYDEAIEWYKRALAGREKALGKDHPSTLRTAKCLRTVKDIVARLAHP